MNREKCNPAYNLKLRHLIPVYDMVDYGSSVIKQLLKDRKQDPTKFPSDNYLMVRLALLGGYNLVVGTPATVAIITGIEKLLN